jgi:hypothetical protein
LTDAERTELDTYLNIDRPSGLDPLPVTSGEAKRDHVVLAVACLLAQLLHSLA